LDTIRDDESILATRLEAEKDGVSGDEQRYTGRASFASRIDRKHGAVDVQRGRDGPVCEYQSSKQVEILGSNPAQTQKYKTEPAPNPNLI